MLLTVGSLIVATVVPSDIRATQAGNEEGDFQRPTTIALTTLAPRDSSWHKALERMGAEWRRATDGAVRLRVYPGGGSFSDESGVILGMRMGRPDAAAISNDGLAEIEPDAFALNMPLVFADYEEWDHVRRQVNPMLEQRLAEKGFVVVTWSDVGWVRFFTKQPLVYPDDLKEMSLAASPDAPEELQLFKSLGFNPVPTGVLDVHSGLQTGRIDSLYMPIIMASASNLYREVGYMTELEWAPLQGAIIVRSEVWEALPAAHREAMSRIGRDIGAQQQSENRADEEAALRAMRSRGLRVVTLDEAAREAWLQLARETYPQVRGELVGAEIFDTVIELRDRYRERGSGGR